MTIGNNIKKLRTAQGLTQDQLAERLFVTRQTISSWERSASHPSLEQLEAIAAALGEDVMTLLYGPKPKYRPSRKRVILAVVLIALAVIALVLGAVLPLQVEGWVMRRRPGWLFYMVAFRLVEGLLLGLGIVGAASLHWPLGLKGKGKRRCLIAALVCLPVSPALFAWIRLGHCPYPIFAFWMYSYEGLELLLGLAAGALVFLAGMPTKRTE